MRTFDDRLWFGVITFWCLMVFAFVFTACGSGGVMAVSADELIPACAMRTVQDPLRGRVPLRSYAGRNFLASGDHLGWDLDLPEGQAVYPIGCGVVRLARAARGYGTLVVVIEHSLGDGAFVHNGAGERVFVDRFFSIYGHLRFARDRYGRDPGMIYPGALVNPGTILGYVQHRDVNGDGLEHLHLGIRLQSTADAQRVDPTAWFRGYDRTPTLRRWFTDPEVFIPALRRAFEGLPNVSLDGGVASVDACDIASP